MLSMEAEIVVERLNIAAVTEAVLVQAAVGAMFDKEAAKHWQTMVKDIVDGGNAT